MASLTKSTQIGVFPVPKLEMSFYEHKLFHGIKTEAEAYNICKAEMEQSSNEWNLKISAITYDSTRKLVLGVD